MPETIVMLAEQTDNLDTVCFRGSAPLSELAMISQADVFDQETNPNGLQRGLSLRHAADAYDYVARDTDDNYPRAFPEVILNVRDKGVVDIELLEPVEGVQLARITFDLDKILRAKSTKVSRVDGNHRLFYAAGDGKDREPILSRAPFQVHVGLTREQEGSLFLDVNASQKGLNTSHLAVLRSRLTTEEVEVIRNPARAFAMRLATDEMSPWLGMVYMGGSKAGSKAKDVKHPLTFIALEQAVRRMLNKSQYLAEVTTIDARYALVRSWWQSVKATWPEAFEAPQDFLLTKSIGINSMALVGATVIDRAMALGDVEVRDMIAMLEPTKKVVNWHKEAPHDEGVSGMSGNRAVNLIAGRMSEKLPTARGVKAILTA